jgi:NADPH:quinone reductase-like Zn-dependent oxidoreductase
MVSGTYGDLPSLPAVGGREGIGEIVDAHQSVEHLIGKRVRMPFGAWRSVARTRADDLFFVPDGIDPYQGAMAFINPLTAWMLLHAIRELKPGDWVIQNAANSAVGIAVVQIARSMGLGTINLVRDAEHRRERLMECGATLVFDEENYDPKALESFTEHARPLLGLNSIGGNSVMRLIKSMAVGGEVVTFGGMVGETVRFPTRELIFSDLRLRGFWLDKWAKGQSHGTLQAMYDTVFSLIGGGIVAIPIDSTVPLSESPAALLSAHNRRKNGKVLVVNDVKI